uniref:Ig-like domain-containing protein n=1 Tax=Astatotilapia calliptera TaxID=8154 RepID=A0AAX7UNL1_ASTCA
PAVLLFTTFKLSIVYDPEIPADSGQDVTLTCRVPNNNILTVEWSRADLEPKYVYVHRDGRFDPDNQHPSFKNRVDLQMKDGDVSLILKDVTINDAGTYKCRVKREGDSMKLISIIYLRVDPPGEQSSVCVIRGEDAPCLWILCCSSLITYMNADIAPVSLLQFSQNTQRMKGRRISLVDLKSVCHLLVGLFQILFYIQ